MRLSYIFMGLGTLLLLLGSYDALRPLATVTVGPMSVSGISATSATLIFVGAIFFFAGIGLYLKHK